MITARRFFNIVKETTLVSNELVVRLHTPAGWTYSFEKSFFRNAERSYWWLTHVDTDIILPHSDAAEETKSNPPPPQLITTPTSLTVTQDDSSSIANLSVANTWEQTNVLCQKHQNDSPIHSPSSSNPNNTTIDVSMKSDIWTITDTMNNDIERVLTDLQDSPKAFTQSLQTDIKHYIDNAIATAFTNHKGFTTMAEITDKSHKSAALEKELKVKKESLNEAEIQHKKAVNKMEGRFHFLTNKMEKFENQIQTKIHMLTSQTSQFLETKKDEFTTKMEDSMTTFLTKYKPWPPPSWTWEIKQNKCSSGVAFIKKSISFALRCISCSSSKNSVRLLFPNFTDSWATQPPIRIQTGLI